MEGSLYASHQKASVLSRQANTDANGVVRRRSECGVRKDKGCDPRANTSNNPGIHWRIQRLDQGGSGLSPMRVGGRETLVRWAEAREVQSRKSHIGVLR